MSCESSDSENAQEEQTSRPKRGRRKGCVGTRGGRRGRGESVGAHRGTPRQSKKAKKKNEKEKRDGDHNWRNFNNNYNNPSLAVPFLERSGPSRIAARNKSPVDFLKLVFSMQMFEMIVTQTNLYRQQCKSTKPSPIPWTDVTVEEILANH